MSTAGSDKVRHLCTEQRDCLRGSVFFERMSKAIVAGRPTGFYGDVTIVSHGNLKRLLRMVTDGVIMVWAVLGLHRSRSG